MNPVIPHEANGSYGRHDSYQSMPIAVVGTGYVGLVAGACFAAYGHRVTCVDVDKNRVSLLNSGRVPFYEPGLDELVGNGVTKGCLKFSTDLAAAVRGAQVIFVTVGTPSKEDGSADLTAVFNVAESVARLADSSAIIVLKSTVPVGTTDLVREHVARAVENPLKVIVNPEFLREGKAIKDFFYPDRVVIGAEAPDAAQLLQNLYASVVGDQPIFVMDPRSAEMVKYISNCFLATKLSFINEMANVCDAVGADIEVVRHAVGMDSRIGTSYMAPGLGYGGSCLPKDLRALESVAIANGVQLEMIPAVQRVNLNQALGLVQRILDYFGGSVKGRRVAVWGLSFKPDTDDVREAPSLNIIQRLLDMGATVAAFDPQAEKTAAVMLGEAVEYNDDMYQALKGAEALIVATEWDEFRSAELHRIRETLSIPVVFDGRNIYEPTDMRKAGLEYYCIGRPVKAGVTSQVV
jgi:UDPglucose 6-dehydrogenase